jgi:hypothetical protein
MVTQEEQEAAAAVSSGPPSWLVRVHDDVHAFLDMDTMELGQSSPAWGGLSASRRWK